MEHACRDRMKKRYAIWSFRRTRLFANACCKMHGARGRIAGAKNLLFYKAFRHTRRDPGPRRGGLVFGPFPYARVAALRA